MYYLPLDSPTVWLLSVSGNGENGINYIKIRLTTGSLIEICSCDTATPSLLHVRQA